MAGIVTSSKRRVLLDKKIKEIEVPTNTLNTTVFFQDLNTVGGMKSQGTLEVEMTNLPTLVKNESTTVLVVGGYKEGIIYGYNGDTKSIEEFTFTRNSSGTRFNALGLPELIAPNVPRVDYDPISKTLKGYLLEPAATNLLLYSGMGNYGSNQVIYSPDQARATFVTESNRQCLKIGVGISLRLSPVTLTPSKKYIYSFWIKSASTVTLRLSNYNTASYNISTIEIGTQWQKVTKAFETPAGTTTDILHIQKLDSTDMPEVFISDLQLEEGEVATSYIPTTNAAATRTADTITSNRPLDNFPTVTVFMKGSWVSSNFLSASSLFVTKSLNSRFWFETVYQGPYVRTYNGSVGLVSLASENSEVKIAVSLYPTGFKHSVNGVDVKTANEPFPNEVLPLIIKSDRAILYLKALAIIPRQLTDQELLTTTT